MEKLTRRICSTAGRWQDNLVNQSYPRLQADDHKGFSLDERTEQAVRLACSANKPDKGNVGTEFN